MADHTFAVGESLTASNVNTYLAHTGGAWNTWTPAVVQSGSVTSTVASAAYIRVGRFIYCEAVLNITGAGTGTNSITVSLPVTGAARYGSSSYAAGTGFVIDTSATSQYAAIMQINSTTTAYFAPATGTAVNGALGASSPMTAALANGDFLKFSLMYEAASG